MKTFNQFNEAVNEGKHPGAFPIDQIDSYIRDLNALDKNCLNDFISFSYELACKLPAES